MAARPELVIFDCDGVLIDSERLAVRVDVELLRELGWPLSEAEVIQRFVGRSDRDTQAAIEAHLRRKLPDTCIEAMLASVGARAPASESRCARSVGVSFFAPRRGDNAAFP